MQDACEYICHSRIRTDCYLPYKNVDNFMAETSRFTVFTQWLTPAVNNDTVVSHLSHKIGSLPTPV